MGKYLILQLLDGRALLFLVFWGTSPLSPRVTYILFFIFFNFLKNAYLLRKRERERSRERERIPSRLHSTKPDMGLKLTNREIMTWAKSQTLHQLSHPGTPSVLHFKWWDEGVQSRHRRPVRRLLPVTQIRDAGDMNDRGHGGGQWWQAQPQPASAFSRDPTPNTLVKPKELPVVLQEPGLFQNPGPLGAPGWLSQLSVQLQLRSWSHSPRVRAPRKALCWYLRAWSLLWILCLPPSLPLPCSCSVSLCLKNKNKNKILGLCPGCTLCQECPFLFWLHGEAPTVPPRLSSRVTSPACPPYCHPSSYPGMTELFPLDHGT